MYNTESATAYLDVFTIHNSVGGTDPSIVVPVSTFIWHPMQPTVGAAVGASVGVAVGDGVGTGDGAGVGEPVITVHS